MSTYKFNSFVRLKKHIGDLSKNINKSSRSILVLCFFYNAEPFVPHPTENNNKDIKEAVKRAVKCGVENWQVNLKIDKNEVSIIKYFKLFI